MGLLEAALAPLRRPSLAKASEALEASARDDAHALDLLDSMEKGLAREQTADLLEPLPDAGNLWKFYVERSSDRRTYSLHCEGGEFLLHGVVCKSGRRVNLFLYNPSEKERALFDLYRPAFVLECNESRTEWTLYEERCDVCRNASKGFRCECGGRRELLRVHHSDQNIGHGVNHCMDVRIPARDGVGLAEELDLVTKLPAWNKKLECLVLDFKGRKMLASAKNFQLFQEGDESERVVCQYGKISPNRLSLDFRYPLTVSQAFALSLTTTFWT